jgi:short chain dehydrogenase
MMLKYKVAVIYGAGGDVGGAVARAFAREGAKLFLSGRNLHKVEAVAADVIGRGGVAEAAQIDALDEQAVEKYVGAVAEKAGAIDISFSAISIVNALPNRAPASGALDRSVCASHHDLYDGEFPHGAERGEVGCEARRTCSTFTQGRAKRMQSGPPSKIMLRKNRPATGTTLSRYLTNPATSIWRSRKILLRPSSYDRCSGIRTLVSMPH